jgi:hypothetical protein
MKITTVTVRLGKTVPNPLREFSNLRADVELTATPGKGSRSDETYAALRAKVEALLDRTLAAMRAEEEALYLEHVKGWHPLCTCGHSIFSAHGRWEDRGVASGGHGPCLDPAHGTTCGWADEEATLCTFCAARQGEQPPF